MTSSRYEHGDVFTVLGKQMTETAINDLIKLGIWHIIDLNHILQKEFAARLYIDLILQIQI